MPGAAQAAHDEEVNMGFDDFEDLLELSSDGSRRSMRSVHSVASLSAGWVEERSGRLSHRRRRPWRWATRYHGGGRALEAAMME